ncbi:hypothetical protein TVTCOM_23510 [Terrisporobacter vanillatitrophus]
MILNNIICELRVYQENDKKHNHSYGQLILHSGNK